ncbi:MAG: L-histidine N(alpha)-methyltransferase [Reichenbachiella sp.]
MFETSTISPPIQNVAFLNDVINGLSKKQKSISSKYFYDETGDRIFQEIMELEAYYLTKAEYEIFKSNKEIILSLFSPNQEPFNLIEFGAGDGYKTKVLLQHFTEQKVDFRYLPIDISQNALDGLENDLKQNIPNLSVSGLQGDYFEVLEGLSHSSNKKNIVLFLGSNIGNFNDKEAISFLSKLRSDLNHGDMILIGIDLKKDPQKILNAYDDNLGVTANFNLNLLTRMNKELGANFDLTKFQHHATYDPVSGECKSSLLSLEEQKVAISDQTFSFEKWEPIHTEISRKYHLSEVQEFALNSSFSIVEGLQDANGYFVDSIWKAR